jgi:hypothetical protein
MLEYEYDHLQSLSNVQWLLYPFVKTAQVGLKNLRGLCKPRNEVLKMQKARDFLG